MSPVDKLKLKNISLILVLLVLSFFPFLPGLRAPFFYDDHNTIVLNPAVRAPESYWDFFTKPETFSSDRARMFRPLTMLSLALSWRVFEERMLGWRMLGLLTHLLCVVLVYVLIQALGGSRFLAFVVALFFGIHPSRVSAVIYLSARSELFASCFYLLSFLLFLWSMTKRIKTQEIFLGLSSLICFWLGLLSKDIAITLPLVLTLERAIFRRTDKKSIYWLLVFWANAGIYFLIRKILSVYSFFPEARPRPVLENLLIQARMIVYYLRWLIFPLHPSFEINFSPAGGFELGLSIIFLLAMVGSGIYLSTKYRSRLGFFVVSFFIILSPSSSLIPLVVEGNIIRAYLAGITVFLLLGEFISRIYFWGFKKLSLTFGILIIACFSTLSLNWASKWQTPTKLWRETVKNFPDHSRAHNNLGLLLERAGNFEQAEREYYLALKADPKNASALGNYARRLLANGEFSRSELYFIKSLQLEPFNCITRINYSQLLITTNRLEEAKELLLEVDFCPGYEPELENQRQRVKTLLSVP